MPNRDYLTAQGNPITEADVALAMGNWGSIHSVNGQASIPPHTQTGPTNTIVLALTMMPLSTGIFGVMLKASFSDGTTAGSLKHQLVAKQGAGTGQLSGGVGAGKFGSAVPGAGAGQSSTYVGANGQILNVDAAGAGGLTFEGGAFGGQVMSEDIQGTLTGLLTANGIGSQNFEYFGILDSTGPGGGPKVPFTLGRPASFGLLVTDTAAHVVTYDSVSLTVFEWPVA